MENRAPLLVFNFNAMKSTVKFSITKSSIFGQLYPARFVLFTSVKLDDGKRKKRERTKKRARFVSSARSR